MTVVVDASVAIRWFVEQPGSDVADQVLRSTSPLLAPELILAEVGNGLWRYVRARLIEPEAAMEAMRRLPGELDQFVPLEPLSVDAIAIATSLDHPIYDCFYLALAESRDTRLLTADKRLIGKTRRTRFARHVVALVDYRA